jgi:hypothetical protein
MNVEFVASDSLRQEAGTHMKKGTINNNNNNNNT